MEDFQRNVCVVFVLDISIKSEGLDPNDNANLVRVASEESKS
jgi:hypothetical protein